MTPAGWFAILAVSDDMKNLGWGVAALGVLLVSMSLMMGIRKKMRKRGTKVTARETLERYKGKAQVRDDLERVMVEVEQMARRVAAQLDAKTIAIEKLLAEADEKIARLEALRADDSAAPPAADPFNPGNPANPGKPATSAAHPPAASHSPPRQSPPDADPSQPATAAPDDLAARVHALADEGLPPGDIARKLDEHIGKVELILALRRA